MPNRPNSPETAVVTQKQIAYLVSLGVQPAEAKRLTRKQASVRINELLRNPAQSAKSRHEMETLGYRVRTNYDLNGRCWVASAERKSEGEYFDATGDTEVAALAALARQLRDCSGNW